MHHEELPFDSVALNSPSLKYGDPNTGMPLPFFSYGGSSFLSFTMMLFIFLKLDTMTGKIWQVQFSVKGEDYRFETVLSSVDITETLKQEKKIGRFTLYPTQNTYNFVMLDQLDGYTYQVQWSDDWENRFVLPIPN